MILLLFGLCVCLFLECSLPVCYTVLCFMYVYAVYVSCILFLCCLTWRNKEWKQIKFFIHFCYAYYVALGIQFCSKTLLLFYWFDLWCDTIEKMWVKVLPDVFCNCPRNVSEYKCRILHINSIFLSFLFILRCQVKFSCLIQQQSYRCTSMTTLPFCALKSICIESLP